MCEDETIQHVALKCEKYDNDRMEIKYVILTEIGCEINGMV